MRRRDWLGAVELPGARLDVADAGDMGGGEGVALSPVIADYGIERLCRDVRLSRIYEGTSQIQQLVIARETINAGG